MDRWESVTALVKVFMDPCVSVGKAFLWAASPWYFNEADGYPEVYRTFSD
jgi:hypothetical protein